MTEIMNNQRISNLEEGRKLALYSMALNMALTAIKYFLYLMTQSSALLAETVHSLADVIAGLFVLLGIYISDKKSEHFPWGLYKVENIGALLVGGMIILSGFGIAKMIYAPSAVNVEGLDMALISLLLMVIPVLLFAVYEEKRAKVLRSPLLIADAENWKMDIAPLVVVTLGVAGTKLSFPFMDRIAAFIILLLIFKTGYEILKDSLKTLLDASADNKTINEIKEVITSFSEVKEITFIEARRGGRFLFININIILSLENFRDAHNLADAIAAALKEHIPFVEKVVIHYEPIKKKNCRSAVLLDNSKERLSDEFGCSPYIGLFNINREEYSILNADIEENPFYKEKSRKAFRLIDYFISNDIDTLYVNKHSNTGRFRQVLEKAGIKTEYIDCGTLKELVEQIHNSQG